jgi:hypothetical protein
MRLLKIRHGILLICACIPAVAQEQSGNACIDIGQKKFCVPASYLLPDLPTSLVPVGPGMDQSRSILAEIPLTELGIESHAQGRNRFLFSVHIAIEEGLGEDIIESDAKDAWYGKKLYRDRIIEHDHLVNLFRIYPKSGYSMLWHYFSASPRPNSEIFWIASCRGSVSDPSNNVANAICTTRIGVRGIHVSIVFSGKYIKFNKDISSGVTKIVSSWERK